MVGVPDATPDTRPETVWTVASEVLEDNQVPPVGVEDNVDPTPIQTTGEPEIAEGMDFTVNALVV